MARPSAAAPEGADDARLTSQRRIAIGVLILLALGSVAIRVPGDHSMPVAERWFLLVGTVVFVIVTYAFGLGPGTPRIRPAPWAAITLILGLAVALFAVG